MIKLNEETRALIGQIDMLLGNLKDMIQDQVQEEEDTNRTLDDLMEHIDDIQDTITNVQEEQGWI